MLFNLMPLKLSLIINLIIIVVFYLFNNSLAILRQAILLNKKKSITDLKNEIICKTRFCKIN